MQATTARRVVERGERSRTSLATAAGAKPAKKKMTVVASKLKKNQLAFRYRMTDTPMSVTRETAQALAEALGVDETQMVHMAIRKLATETLPQYQADDGALSAAQVAAIKKASPQGEKRPVRSTLFGVSA